MGALKTKGATPTQGIRSIANSEAYSLAPVEVRISLPIYMTNETFRKFVLHCRRPKLDTKLYLAVGLGGECGEVLNEVKKEYRDRRSRRAEVLDEAGDLLHYLVALLNRYGITLEEVMIHNVLKLAARYAMTDQVRRAFTGEKPATKPKQSRAVWRKLRTIIKTWRTLIGVYLQSLLDLRVGTLSSRTLRSMLSTRRSKR